VELYSTFIAAPHTQGAQVWITQFYLQISPDGTTNNCGSRHPIAAYSSFVDPEKTKG